MTNHYETLGVPSDADVDTIRRAYRKLSSEHHPDREGGDDARMAEINAAYETLCDPAKRERYDRTGASGPSRLENDAEELVTQLVLQVLDNRAGLSIPVDVFPYVKQELAKQEGQLLEQMKAAGRRRQQLERNMKRLKRRTDKRSTTRRDFLKQAFQHRIDLLLEGDRKAEQHIEMLRLAQQYANGYEMEPDQETSQPFLYAFLERPI